MEIKRIVKLLLLSVALTGCSAASAPDWIDGAPHSMDVVVTVKQAEDGTVFFQLHDDERLFPGAEYPFTRQERAWGALTIYAEEVPLYGHRAEVEWLEPLDEGPLLASAPSLDSPLGLDPDLRSWITSVEDGYLTLHYKTWWGDPAGHHDFYLVAADKSDPYNLTLLQDAHTDSRDNYSEGIICFDINTLPDTGDTYKTLTLNWTPAKEGRTSAQFEFRTRK